MSPAVLALWDEDPDGRPTVVTKDLRTAAG